jgi:hypothetical protein
LFHRAITKKDRRDLANLKDYAIYVIDRSKSVSHHRVKLHRRDEFRR